jgi:hypothetical protein
MSRVTFEKPMSFPSTRTASITPGGSVGADPPAFGLEPPGPRRSGERLSRNLSGLVLEGEEFREWLPDNLLSVIALDPRCTRIPLATHPSRSIV